MVFSKAQTVDEYLAQLSGERRQALAALREIVQSTVPNATETMTYGMPTYFVDPPPAKPFCSFASQKNYMALYICDTDLLAARRAEFDGMSVGKSCVRFGALDELPLDVVETLVGQAAKKTRDENNTN